MAQAFEDWILAKSGMLAMTRSEVDRLPVKTTEFYKGFELARSIIERNQMTNQSREEQLEQFWRKQEGR